MSARGDRDDRERPPRGRGERRAIGVVAIGAIVSAMGASACGSSAVPVKATPETTARDAGAVAAREASVEAGAGASAIVAGGPSREERLIAKMLKRVSEARGLSANHPVPGATLARDALIDKVKEHVAREVPPEAIRQEGLVLQLLGLVPQKFDYEAETFKLLEAQLAGYYEPSDGTMYLASDLDDDNADATLAHELVHALQDQHFDLKPHSKYVPGQSDKQAAFSALAEGDATSAMADVLVARTAKGKNALDLPEEIFVEQVLASVSSGAAAKAPHVMRTSLVAPYIYGTLFVHALRRKGGWAAVDQAWRNLPTTTEQILHVEKWRIHEAPLDVNTPGFTALGATAGATTGVSAGDGWKVSDDDSFGELGLRVAFEEWMGADDAKEAAGGWGGDRALLVENGARSAIAIHVRFDAQNGAAPDGFARRSFRLLARGIEASVGHAALKDAAFVCVDRPELGPLAVMRSGRELVITAGPAKKDASAWSAAATCAQAKKWGSEVAKP